MFGTEMLLEPKPEPATAKVAAAMHARWVDFVKTGKPGDWPPFTADKEEWLDFTGNGAVAKQDLLKARLDFVETLAPWAPPTN